MSSKIKSPIRKTEISPKMECDIIKGVHRFFFSFPGNGMTNSIIAARLAPIQAPVIANVI